MSRLVLLATSPRVAAGLLSAEAWSTVHAGPVFAADLELPTAASLVGAGIPVQPTGTAGDVDATAQLLLGAVRGARVVTWLLGADDPSELIAALSRLGCRPADQLDASAADRGTDPLVEVMDGSWDLPGARLIDVVSTMDRLRSPGGCPWDAEQDHRSLAPYLLEEAYEAFQAIEDDDLAALRAELGDVLLQVAFHARLAEELDDGRRWDVDDVATGLVAKLERRHPHVFGDVTVTGADQVNANWDAIKSAERAGRSPLADVPLSAPALTLAARLQRKSGTESDSVTGDVAGSASTIDRAVRDFDTDPSDQTAGALLWSLVARMRALGIDAEGALRAHARAFRDAAIGDDAQALEGTRVKPPV